MKCGELIIYVTRPARTKLLPHHLPDGELGEFPRYSGGNEEMYFRCYCLKNVADYLEENDVIEKIVYVKAEN